jgi:small subunit ribosomal protein S16
MLVIRLQRTGRSGHAQFRVVVQDSRRTPTSGNIVAALGHFDPHTKKTVLDKEKAQHFLDHGAQPTSRTALLLKSEGVKLPKWVKLEAGKKRAVRNIDKRRSTRPAEEKVVVAQAETPEAAEEKVEEAPAAENETEAEAEAPENAEAEPAAEPLKEA